MQRISIIEAWVEWSAGRLDPANVLWGLKILWWGRIGITLKFLSSALVLFEIIGAVNLRYFSGVLKNTITPELLRSHYIDTFAWFRAMRIYQKAKQGQSEKRGIALRAARRRKLHRYNLLVAACLFIWFNLSVDEPPIILNDLAFGNVYKPLIEPLFEDLIFYMLIYYFVSPFVTMAASMTVYSVAWITRNIILIPTANLLSHEKLNQYVKLAGLIGLVIGFHFSILAA